MTPEPLDGLLRRVLGGLRSRGSRLVNFTPETGIGVGNMFSFWYWAHEHQAQGLDHWTLRTEAMEPWLARFPAMTELLVARSDLRLLDNRLLDYYQHFPAERDLLASFITQRVLSSPDLPAEADPDESTVTVNVRRGDYYSVPKFRGNYGFDIASYVQVAMAGAAEQAPISSVAVVSDDPDWCRLKLGWLADFGEVRFQDPGDGPWQNFVQLARARRLVLANSSFSYWAAYTSNVWHGDNHHLVWAPIFHNRGINYGRAWQLDPQWSIVDDIPGGWNA